MAKRYPQPVFLDATVVSNFDSTDGITFLTTLLDSPVVSPAVRDEIERGAHAGYEYLGAAVDAFGESLPVRGYRLMLAIRISAPASTSAKRNRSWACSLTAERWRRTT